MHNMTAMANCCLPIFYFFVFFLRSQTAPLTVDKCVFMSQQFPDSPCVAMNRILVIKKERNNNSIYIILSVTSPSLTLNFHRQQLNNVSDMFSFLM